MDRFSGKRVLVIGSGTGIGREVALEFARQGDDVVVHYSHSEKGARSATDEIRAMGRRTAVFQADLSKVEDVRGLGARAIGAVTVENHFKTTPGVDVEKAVREFRKLIPCGFAGTPLDIGKLATFLASDDARYIAGQTIVADGGTTSWMAFSEAYKAPMTTRSGKGYVPGGLR